MEHCDDEFWIWLYCIVCAIISAVRIWLLSNDDILDWIIVAIVLFNKCCRTTIKEFVSIEELISIIVCGRVVRELGIVCIIYVDWLDVRGL